MLPRSILRVLKFVLFQLVIDHLVCLRDLKPGEEITCNWSTKEDNEIVLESDSEGLLIASPFYDSE